MDVEKTFEKLELRLKNRPLMWVAVNSNEMRGRARRSGKTYEKHFLMYLTPFCIKGISFSQRRDFIMAFFLKCEI